MKAGLARHYGGLASITSQAIASLSNFLTAVLAAKVLTPDDFGIYNVLATSLVVISGMTGSVVTVPMRVLGIAGGDGRPEFRLSSQLALQTLLGLFFTVLGMLLLAVAYPIDVRIAFAFFAYVLASHLQELTRSATTTQFQWNLLLLSDGLTHITRIGFLIIMLHYDKASVAFILAIIAATSLAGGVLLTSATPSLAFSLAAIKSTWERNWNFGKWLLIESIVYSGSTQVYMYLIASMLDFRSAGAFGAAQTVLNSLNVLLIGGMNYVIPVARQLLLDKGYRAWQQWFRYTGVLVVSATCAACIAISTFSAPLMSLLFSQEYADFSALIPPLSIAMVLSSINMVLSAAFRTAERPQVGFIGKCISAALTLGLAGPLILSWGAHGAAIGMIITQLSWITVYSVAIYYTGLLAESRVSEQHTSVSVGNQA